MTYFFGTSGTDRVAVELHTPVYSGCAADWSLQQVEPILYGDYDDIRIGLTETTLGTGTCGTVSQGLLRHVEYIESPGGTVRAIRSAAATAPRTTAAHIPARPTTPRG